MKAFRQTAVPQVLTFGHERSTYPAPIHGTEPTAPVCAPTAKDSSTLQPLHSSLPKQSSSNPCSAPQNPRKNTAAEGVPARPMALPAPTARVFTGFARGPRARLGPVSPRPCSLSLSEASLGGGRSEVAGGPCRRRSEAQNTREGMERRIDSIDIDIALNYA